MNIFFLYPSLNYKCVYYAKNLLWYQCGENTQLNSGTWYLIPEFIKLVKTLKFDVFLFSIVVFSDIFYSLHLLYIKFLSG